MEDTGMHCRQIVVSGAVVVCVPSLTHNPASRLVSFSTAHSHYLSIIMVSTTFTTQDLGLSVSFNQQLITLLLTFLPQPNCWISQCNTYPMLQKQELKCQRKLLEL